MSSGRISNGSRCRTSIERGNSEIWIAVLVYQRYWKNAEEYLEFADIS